MYRLALLAALVVQLGLGLSAARAAEPTGQVTDNVTGNVAGNLTVLAGPEKLELDKAVVEGDELWVPLSAVTQITGFELKPQGLCAGDVCIALPPDGSWKREQDGQQYLCVTRFARSADQQYAVADDRRTWSFTAVPQAATIPLLEGVAPDFTLKDCDGQSVRLSDFRGKKVLLWTWASWCACRFDLAGWQKVYEDLKDQDFEIIACAQDTAGVEACKPWYDKAGVTYSALVDPHHTVSSLYQMVNVPTGVWIDEAGKIVRPPEVAYSKQDTVLGRKIGDDRYAQGVRDWVEHGAQSKYLVTPEELQSQIHVRDSNERLAEAQFRLGTHFLALGDREQAARHWQESQRLNPDSWNYHRQEWSFNKPTEMLNFLNKVRKLGDRPYYAPVEFPEAGGP